MLRAVLYSLIGLLLITFMRMVIGILMKGAGEMFNPTTPEPAANTNMPAGGELKRDPVCGTYVPAETSITAQAGGRTYHYCSKKCRDEHKV